MDFNILNTELYSPWFLLLFLLFIPLIIRDLQKKKKKGILVPTTKNMLENSTIVFVMSFLKITKYIILTSLIIAIARPRTFSISNNQDENKGIDIVL
jgi:Ca-activated chloride channel family protein